MVHPITQALGIELARGGRIPVRPDLLLAGHPEVFAIGDIVYLIDFNEVLVPGVSPGAIQMGIHVAKLLRAEMDGNQAVKRYFRYWDKGSMATIGRSAAIAQVAGLHEQRTHAADQCCHVAVDNPRGVSGQENSRPFAIRDGNMPRWLAARVTAQHRAEAARDLLLEKAIMMAYSWHSARHACLSNTSRSTNSQTDA